MLGQSRAEGLKMNLKYTGASFGNTLGLKFQGALTKDTMKEEEKID